MKRKTSSRPRIRRSWKINPAQHPHSTQKGRKGYDRKRERSVTEEQETEIEDNERQQPPPEKSENPIIYKGHPLDKFQEDAIHSLEKGRSIIVSAPTGAGKTLIAEYAIESALARGKQIIYTSPIKALSNQKFREFSLTHGSDVGIMTGDVTINRHAPTLIMTTEIFRNTIYEDPERLAHAEFVIFDEIHYINDPERGTVWEESIIFAPQQIKFVCLSATVPNLHEMADWISSIRHINMDVIEEKNRPVPLHESLYEMNSGFVKLDRLRKMMFSKKGKKHWHHKSRRRASIKLIDHVIKSKQLPCLYFCFSRKLCEAKASSNVERNFLTPSQTEESLRIFDGLCERFNIHGDKNALAMRRLVEHGIAFHHAGLMPTLKEVVESLFSTGLIKMLFATETFALGVNMPACSVIFDSLEKYDGVSFDYIKTRGFRQMAGRAGRRGMDEQGFVYAHVDAIEDDFAEIKRIFRGTPERVESQFNVSYSTILSLYDRLGDGMYDACNQSFRNFQRSRRKKDKRSRRSDRDQEQQIHRRFDLLLELGYVDKDRLLDKGRIAARINGYELQVTELLAAGYLDELSDDELNILFQAIVHESRRGRGAQIRRRPPHFPRKLLKDIEQNLRLLRARERVHKIRGAIKTLDFSLSEAIHAWSQGCDFDELGEFSPLSDGDLVRTFRVTIQLLRQTIWALDDAAPLRKKLRRAMAKINRDVIDAERELRAAESIELE